MPAPFHWWQQGSARAQRDSPAAREGREGVRVQAGPGRDGTARGTAGQAPVDVP